MGSIQSKVKTTHTKARVNKIIWGAIFIFSGSFDRVDDTSSRPPCNDSLLTCHLYPVQHITADVTNQWWVWVYIHWGPSEPVWWPSRSQSYTHCSEPSRSRLSSEPQSDRTGSALRRQPPPFSIYSRDSPAPSWR